MKVRDEFLCPITYELLREPMCAKDGHTYEKAAIEKWLKSNRNSPRSGEPMDECLHPNINLKKLIQDLINEGGAGLYTQDTYDTDRLFDVYAEKAIILKCLGPPESDWNLQSFQVTQQGYLEIASCTVGSTLTSRPNNPASLSLASLSLASPHTCQVTRLGCVGGRRVKLLEDKDSSGPQVGSYSV